MIETKNVWATIPLYKRPRFHYINYHNSQQWASGAKRWFFNVLAKFKTFRNNFEYTLPSEWVVTKLLHMSSTSPPILLRIRLVLTKWTKFIYYFYLSKCVLKNIPEYRWDIKKVGFWPLSTVICIVEYREQ